MQPVIDQLVTAVGGFLPGLIGAVVLVVVAWIVATIVRFAIVRLATAVKLEQRTSATGLNRNIGDAGFWLVWLIMLPGILGALGMQGLLIPVQSLVNQVLGFVPNLFATALIIVIGVFVAQLVRRIVTNLLIAAGSERLAARVGISAALGQQGLAGVLGLIVYILILLPVITAALNALAITAITGPVSGMLNTILNTIPNLFAAAIIVAVTFMIGRVLANLVSNLLAGIGVDRVPAQLGLRQVPTSGSGSASSVIGTVIFVTMLSFAAIEAARTLGFVALAAVFVSLVGLAGQIVLGLVILVVGLYLANLAARAIASSGMAHADLLASASRVVVLVLIGSMAVRQMGLANDIINLAFGLILGAVAVAIALAFGLGGRESAARVVESWRQTIVRPSVIRSVETPDSHIVVTGEAKAS